MGILTILNTIGLIITVITGVKNFRTIKKLKDKGQDILATKIADGGKIPVIYGRRRVGATLLYMDTDAGNSRELFVVYGLCLGEIDSMEEVVMILQKDIEWYSMLIMEQMIRLLILCL